MTKKDSQILKGVAILLMLFYHLFFMKRNAGLCSHMFYIDGIGLAYYISRMANPVSFFIILSGYGLYAVNKKGDANRWRRLRRIILHYWLILFIFVTIGHVMFPNTYPGNFINIINNITAFHTTYNGEHWFIFPYLLLAISSPFLFRICDNYKPAVVLGMTFFLYLFSCFLISKYGNSYLYTHMLAYHPILYTSLLFNFILGALACKNGWLNKENYNITSSWAWILLTSICIIRCMFKSSAFHNLFVFAFIWLWLQTNRPKWLDSILAHFGHHSMNIWLIHTFFCYYLFHDWIYGFKYPVFVYSVLLLVSYLSSHIINRIYLLPSLMANKTR